MLVAQRKASWWEHWSSGVVLILLIIALVTASILALNDGGKSPPEQLAGEPVAALDEFDLSNITIPEVINGEVEPAPVKTQAGTLETQTSTLELTTNTASGVSPIADSSREGGGNGSSSTEQAPRSELMLTSQASLGIPPSATLATQTSTADRGSKSDTTSPPLASLTLPEAVSPPPLFEPNASSDLGSKPPVVPNSEILTPSTLQPSNSGTSPAFYDGAANEVEFHATSEPPPTTTAPVPAAGMPQMAARPSSMPGLVTAGTPIDTQRPSLPALLTAASQPASPTPDLSQPMFPHPALPQTSLPAATPLAPSTVVQSANPEPYSPAIFEAYQQYSQRNQASNGVITNRWETTSQANPTPNSSATPSSGMGFTLGNQPAQ